MTSSPIAVQDFLHNTIVDIGCTLPGCRRTVTASLLEVKLSRPCPLCKMCVECRQLCGQGLVEHGIADGAVFPQLGGAP